MIIAGSRATAWSIAPKLPSACARSVAFCRYMSSASFTFCWLDTKWLCQNSVIRSVRGEGVDSISPIHQPRSSKPSRTCCWRNILSSSSDAPAPRRG
jgi:hypothetical protein